MTPPLHTGVCMHSVRRLRRCRRRLPVAVRCCGIARRRRAVRAAGAAAVALPLHARLVAPLPLAAHRAVLRRRRIVMLLGCSNRTHRTTGSLPLCAVATAAASAVAGVSCAAAAVACRPALPRAARSTVLRRRLLVMLLGCSN